MKLVIHPAVEADRLQALKAASQGAVFVNAATAAEAEAAMPAPTRLWEKSRRPC